MHEPHALDDSPRPACSRGVARLFATCVALLTLVVIPAALAAEPSDVLVAEWHVVGPFESGSREGFVNPLADGQGRLPTSFTFAETYPSALVEGGRVGWTLLAAERDKDGKLTGTTKLALTAVDWESREKEWGPAGLLNVAVLHGTFRLDAPQSLIVEAGKCGLTINGVPVATDPYGAGIARAVIRGRAGVNDVLAYSSGFAGERSFSLRLTPVTANTPAVMILANDVTLPDVVVGHPPKMAGRFLTSPDTSPVVGIPLLNTSDDWITVSGIEVAGALKGDLRESLVLAPRATMKRPASLLDIQREESPPESGPLPDVPVEIRVTTSRGTETATVNARQRRHDEPRVETFTSRIDASAQQLGILEPKDYREDAVYGLIMSLHGAAVGCGGQVASYEPKDWAIVVAPTNRRPYGFDWHDLGRIDFEEAANVAAKRFHVDRDRIVITGHSMGGHGAWLMGALHSDWFASCSPSAGWMGYDTYVPFTTRRSQWFAPPELTALLMQGLAGGRVTPFLENFANLPVLAVHGGADDNVPPPQSRAMVGALQRMGYDAQLHEEPKMGHWWDIDKSRPGADCVDASFLQPFWKDHLRNGAPRHVVFVTTDPDIDPDMYWVELLEQRHPAVESRIVADVIDTHTVRVTTANVAVLALDLLRELQLETRLTVEIDGQAIVTDRPRSCGRIELHRKQESWVAELDMTQQPQTVQHLPGPSVGEQQEQWDALVAAAAAADPDGPALDWQRGLYDFPFRRLNLRPGGFVKSLYEPFVIVVGTRRDPDGGSTRADAMLDLARYLAETWRVRANGLAPIVRDTDLTPELRRRYNLILLGGPDVNEETRALSDSLRIVATSPGATLSGRAVPGRDLAAAHWQENPRLPDRRVLVLQATTPAADSLLVLLNPMLPGAGLPDFVIATPAVRAKSWAGFIAAGTWDVHFGFDPATAWLGFDAGPPVHAAAVPMVAPKNRPRLPR